jgi:hypothetical protein
MLTTKLARVPRKTIKTLLDVGNGLRRTFMEKIPFPVVDLSKFDNPVPAIMSAPEFSATVEYFANSPARQRSLISPDSMALMFSILRNARPEHVAEIGTFRGGTTEGISRALDANGKGLVHTISPVDSEYFLPYLESWPHHLKSRARFYSMDSMTFFTHIQREGIRPWLVFVDGCHDYEYALFDIQCAARSLSSGGFIIIDNISQSGPYFAAADFMAANPLWLNCQWKPSASDLTKAYDHDRVSINNTDFIVLRAPGHYLLDNRPRTFGEVNWPSPRVTGVKLPLFEANKGTLHVECVLRGFSSSQNLETIYRTSRQIDSAQGEFRVIFETPQTLDGEFIARRVEPWFIWDGDTPLKLDDFPVAF